MESKVFSPDGGWYEWQWPELALIPGTPILGMVHCVTTEQYHYYLVEIGATKYPQAPHGMGKVPIVNVSALQMMATGSEEEGAEPISFINWLNRKAFREGFFEKHPLMGNNPDWKEGDDRKYPFDYTLPENYMYKYVEGAVIQHDEVNIPYDHPRFRRGFRLPFEREWILLAHDIEALVKENGLDRYAWYNENSGGRAHPVGLKEPNSAGFEGVLGNAWETVQQDQPIINMPI